jgi:hypothetical protein
MNKAVSKIVPKYKEQKAVKGINYFDEFTSKHYFQLNPFGLQMLHDDIGISAGGFFTVDMHLFFFCKCGKTKTYRFFYAKCTFQIISACGTYLVVVWQFLHFTDQNCF